MVQINFNAQAVAPNASLEALPSGVYDVVVTNSLEKPNSKNTGHYLEFEMTVRSPDPVLNGRKILDRLNIKHPNQQTVDIAFASLSALCHVTGRYQIQDTAQLHGIPIKVVLSKVAREDKPGEFSNDVKGYKDAQGNDPGSAGPASAGPGPGGQPQGYPQQPAPQQPAPQGGQPSGYVDYGGAPQGTQPGNGQGGYGGVPHPNGTQVQGPAPGHSQQTSEQHAANGPAQQPGGGAPPWAGGAAQPQPAPQPQPQPGYQPQPDPNAPPPWAQPSR